MKTLNIFALLGGIAIGAAAALLFAPDSGKNTRNKIYNKLKEKGIELSPEQLELLIEKIKGSCYSNKPVEKS